VYFDPKVYRIVLFDQRGAGKSEPYVLHHAYTIKLSPQIRRPERKHNLGSRLDISRQLGDGADLSVSDIEVLREKLGIDKWVVFGGSWFVHTFQVYMSADTKGARH
jgi:proline iminopeptidase